MKKSIKTYLQKNTNAAPLAVFRIFFGIMMLISIIRFWLNGWIDKLYIQPNFFFTYYGFDWVKPLGNFTYILFAICGISAFFVALGYKYKLSIITFFLSFTYIELIDKTTYLNHYYFISILAFVMIFLPAQAYFSVDAKKNPLKNFEFIPKWNIDVLKLLICIVYFYAGLAKANSDWLLEAMPLKIWLPSKYDIFFLGDFLQQEWVHYTFSWFGFLYDIFIPFLMLYKPTRKFSFFLIVVFHILTRVLFPIGMFPYIMIVSALIFFDASVHQKILGFFSKIFKIEISKFNNTKILTLKPVRKKVQLTILALFFTVQLIFPWRYVLYPGELFWTEEGYRFSWRVMLMEKAGYAQFKIVNEKTEKWFYVDNSDFLSSFQEKQMSFQPDFILQYAHYLAEHFKEQGHQNIAVYVESYAALNGRKSMPFINPEVNLLEHEDSFQHKTFILSFPDEIKGL